jgi:hypothetical protein
VGVLRGSDAKLRGEYVVYTAHLDHLGIGEPVGGDAIYNGARDNASGVAGMLAMSQPFDFESSVKLSQAAFLTGYVVACDTHRPSWHKGDFFSERFGPQR